MTPKKLLIIVLASFLVIVAVACGLRACAAPAVEKLQEQAQEAARVEAARQEAAGLTSADLAAVNAYDDGQNDMASFLEANLWIASNGTSQLRFERGYYIQTDNEGNEQVGAGQLPLREGLQQVEVGLAALAGFSCGKDIG